MKKSAVWINVLKYGVAVALLALMIALNWTGLKNLFSQPPHLGPLALAAALFVSVVLVQYYRWYLLVRALDLPFSLRDAVRLGLVGTFYNSFLPGSIGGDLVKAFSIAKGQPSRKAAAVATVVADRMIGLFGLLLFGGAVGGGFWLAGDEKIAASSKLQFIVYLCAGLATAAVVGYLALGMVNEVRMRKIGERFHRLRRVGHTLAELWFTVWQYRQRPGTVVAAVVLSAVTHLAMMFIFHLAVNIFPPKDPDQLGTLPEHFVIAPIGYIVQAVIPLPGGIGGGELTFGGLYNMIRPGASEVGLAGRLAMRLPEWTIGLVGYIVFLRMKTELPIEEAEQAEEKDDPYGDESPADEKLKGMDGESVG